MDFFPIFLSSLCFFGFPRVTFLSLYICTYYIAAGSKLPCRSLPPRAVSLGPLVDLQLNLEGARRLTLSAENPF